MVFGKEEELEWGESSEFLMSQSMAHDGATDATATDAARKNDAETPRCSLCVAFFSEFDDSKGPVVAFSEPEGSFDEGKPARPMWVSEFCVLQ